jgi:hypothetical protein
MREPLTSEEVAAIQEALRWGGGNPTGHVTFAFYKRLFDVIIDSNAIGKPRLLLYFEQALRSRSFSKTEMEMLREAYAITLAEEIL